MSRELSDQEMDAVFSSETIGHLGCSDGLKPYVVPMAYVFYENVLYGQTTEGKKVQMLRTNPTVCFQVESHHTGEWSSVMCWGRFEELDFNDLHDPDAMHAVQMLTQRIGRIQGHIGINVPFSFSGKAMPLSFDEKTSTLFRIVILEKTGRAYGQA